MRSILAIALKDLRLDYKNPRDLSTLIATPILLALLIAVGLRGMVEKGILHSAIVGSSTSSFHGGASRPAAPTNYYAQVLPSILVMFMLFSTMEMSIGLLKERWMGVLRRILVAPVSKAEFLAGKVLGAVLAILLQFYLVLGFFMLFCGVRLTGSWGGLILTSFLTALCCAALGMLFACAGKTQAAIHGISLLVIMIMSAIGGSMFPVWLMPSWLQTAAHGTINYWAIQALNGVLWQETSFHGILPEMGALLAYTTVLFALSLFFFRFHDA